MNANILLKKVTTSLGEKAPAWTMAQKKKIMVPGLDLTAVEKRTDDKNLSPFRGTSETSIQYGKTSFESSSTDHPD